MNASPARPVVLPPGTVSIQLLGVTVRVPTDAVDHVEHLRTLETAELYWRLGAIADELRHRGVIGNRG